MYSKSHTMFKTDYQRQLFNDILEVNFAIGHAMEQKRYAVMNACIKEKQVLMECLKDEMGEEAFNTFMNRGKAMFAPKTNNNE